MDRIVIIGAAASGKTTLAFNMAVKLGLPVIDLDDLHWQPGWKTTPRDEFKSEVRKSASKDKWIIAGNYSGVRDLVWNRADTVIWLDYNFSMNFWRLLKRTAHRLVDKKPVCNGNHETLSNVFSKNSLIPWFLKTFHERRREYDEIFNDKKTYPHLNKIRLNSQEEADEFLKALAP